jgi:hypothetical protein
MSTTEAWPVSWRDGKRLLTIIDEALANAIEGNKVTTPSLAQVYPG